MNRKVYVIAFLLVALSAAAITAKVIYGGHTVRHDLGRHLWRVNIGMNFTGQGTRAKVRLTLPKDNDRQIIYNEHFENDELVFYVRERPLTGNRIGFWRSEVLEGSKSIQYTFSAQLSSLSYSMPDSLLLPQDPAAAYPPDFKVWLEPSEFIQSKDVSIQKHLKQIIKKERNISRVTKRVYEFVRGEVKYKSEKGSKSAKATLDKLTADCGGQARLFAALSRAAGIPSRVVGGLIMTVGAKNTTHVWVENYIGGRWIPFDVVNGYYAFIPANYIELYRGDYALVKHVGMKKFDYFFVIGLERMPPVDHPWSLYVLPIHFQGMIQVLLLIPIGALVVAFFRTIVGLPTFGTFSPVLLALAFREISLGFGLFLVCTVVFFGWMLRRVLDALKILVIPRLAIVVTAVVAMVLIMLVVGFHMGEQQILYMSLFPMIIMTWLVERFSVLQIEDGTKAAFQSALGTVLVAVSAYYVFSWRSLRAYLFSFPELLLIVAALLLILGRYTGMRLSEVFRFWELKRIQKDSRRE